MLATISPPNNAAKPEPPQDPIDHKLIARCLAAPSQYALTNAKLAGIINAPESPCKILPNNKVNSAKKPEGENPTKSDPIILSIKPILIVLTLPQRSDRFPIITIKIPENNAVTDTAIFIIWV